jgi:hypothetical protein
MTASNLNIIVSAAGIKKRFFRIVAHLKNFLRTNSVYVGLGMVDSGTQNIGKLFSSCPGGVAQFAYQKSKFWHIL